MISNSKQDIFDLVLVHKLDRFARNRGDSIGYRMALKKNGVVLVSVLEFMDEDNIPNDISVGAAKTILVIN